MNGWKSLTTLLLSLIFVLTACGQQAPTWQEQYDLGIRYLSEGNYEEAILAFTAAIDIDPKQALAYVGRGDAYIGSDKTDKSLMAARIDYETAIELDNSLSQVYLELASIYMELGDTQLAISLLTKGVNVTDSPELHEKLNQIKASQNSSLPRFYASVSNIVIQDPVKGHNEGSIGQLNFDYTWDTNQIPPEIGSTICTAYIATWNSNGFSDDEIREESLFYEEIWKAEGNIRKDYPNSRNAFPIWEKDLGTKKQVLLYALNDVKKIIGYLILEVNVPAA